MDNLPAEDIREIPDNPGAVEWLRPVTLLHRQTPCAGRTCSSDPVREFGERRAAARTKTVSVGLGAYIIARRAVELISSTDDVARRGQAMPRCHRRGHASLSSHVPCPQPLAGKVERQDDARVPAATMPISSSRTSSPAELRTCSPTPTSPTATWLKKLFVPEIVAELDPALDDGRTPDRIRRRRAIGPGRPVREGRSRRGPRTCRGSQRSEDCRARDRCRRRWQLRRGCLRLGSVAPDLRTGHVGRRPGTQIPGRRSTRSNCPRASRVGRSLGGESDHAQDLGLLVDRLIRAPPEAAGPRLRHVLNAAPRRSSDGRFPPSRAASRPRLGPRDPQPGVELPTARHGRRLVHTPPHPGKREVQPVLDARRAVARLAHLSDEEHLT